MVTFVIFTPYFLKGNFIGGNFFSVFGYILLVKKGLITYQHIILKLQMWLQKNVINQCEFLINVGTLLAIYNNSSNGIVKETIGTI